jgi:hypothetical protein
MLGNIKNTSQSNFYAATQNLGTCNYWIDKAFNEQSTNKGAWHLIWKSTPRKEQKTIIWEELEIAYTKERELVKNIVKLEPNTVTIVLEEFGLGVKS